MSELHDMQEHFERIREQANMKERENQEILNELEQARREIDRLTSLSSNQNKPLQFLTGGTSHRSNGTTS